MTQHNNKHEYANKYSQWLLQQELPSISNITERLAQTLLRRGFLINYENDFISVHSGIHPQDLKDLTELGELIGFEVQPVESSDKTYVAKLHVGRRLHNDFEQLIILLPSWRGMSACYSKPKTWSAFKSNRFGAKVPTKDLDLGISLLIKTLPLLGVRTLLCCDGHGQCQPYVKFCGQHYLNWFLFIIEKIKPDLPLLNKITFAVDSESDKIYFSLKDQPSWQSKQIIEIFDTLFQLGKHVMNMETILYFQLQKQEYIHAMEHANRRLLQA